MTAIAGFFIDWYGNARRTEAPGRLSLRGRPGLISDDGLDTPAGLFVRPR
jgi:hypothetical protein